MNKYIRRWTLTFIGGLVMGRFTQYLRAKNSDKE